MLKLNPPDKARTPDPLWDAVCEAFGLHPATKSDRSRVGRIVADLRTKGAAPADVPVRLDRYRRTWPKVAATPEALLKHWDTFRVEQVPAGDANPCRVRSDPGKYANIGKVVNANV